MPSLLLPEGANVLLGLVPWVLSERGKTHIMVRGSESILLELEELAARRERLFFDFFNIFFCFFFIFFSFFFMWLNSHDFFLASLFSAPDRCRLPMAAASLFRGGPVLLLEQKASASESSYCAALLQQNLLKL